MRKLAVSCFLLRVLQPSCSTLQCRSQDRNDGAHLVQDFKQADTLAQVAGSGGCRSRLQRDSDAQCASSKDKQPTSSQPAAAGKRPPSPSSVEVFPLNSKHG